MFTQICYVRGCQKIAKANVHLLSERGLAFCDEHLDEAATLSDSFMTALHNLVEDTLLKMRNIGQDEGK